MDTISIINWINIRIKYLTISQLVTSHVRIVLTSIIIDIWLYFRKTHAFSDICTYHTTFTKLPPLQNYVTRTSFHPRDKVNPYNILETFVLHRILGRRNLLQLSLPDIFFYVILCWRSHIDLEMRPFYSL